MFFLYYANCSFLISRLCCPFIHSFINVIQLRHYPNIWFVKIETEAITSYLMELFYIINDCRLSKWVLKIGIIKNLLVISIQCATEYVETSYQQAAFASFRQSPVILNPRGFHGNYVVEGTLFHSQDTNTIMQWREANNQEL